MNEKLLLSQKTTQKALESFKISCELPNLIRFEYKIEDTEYPNSFLLLKPELEHIIQQFTTKQFFPYYQDLSNLVCIHLAGIKVMILNGKQHILHEITFRAKEFQPILESCLLALNNNVKEYKFDAWPEYIRSFNLSTPTIERTISDEALPITKLEGINFFLERANNFAFHYSNGKDDIVQLHISRDSADDDRSLYFQISKNEKFCMNGGIIWHENSKSWGIHT